MNLSLPLVSSVLLAKKPMTLLTKTMNENSVYLIGRAALLAILFKETLLPLTSCREMKGFLLTETLVNGRRALLSKY